MSSLSIYRIRPNGSQAFLGELRNAHGGMPLIWDALADVLDPLTPERLAWYKREFAVVLEMRARRAPDAPVDHINGRWMLDNMATLADRDALAPGETPKKTLERMFLATADSSKDPLYRIAMSASHDRSWIERDSLNLVAAAFRATSRLARSPRVGLTDHVNHLDVLAETLLAEFEAGPEVSIGVRVSWGGGDDPAFRPSSARKPEDVPDDEWEPEIEEPNFLNPCSVVDFGLWEVLHVGELADLGFRERGSTGELQPLPVQGVASCGPDPLTLKWLHDGEAVLAAASDTTGVDVTSAPPRRSGQDGAAYLDMICRAQAEERTAAMRAVFVDGGKVKG